MIRVLLALVPAILAGAGCSVLRSEISSPIAWSQEQFEEGETHYRDVLRELGAPLKISRHRGGIAFLYEHLIVHERQLGISYQEEAFGANVQPLELIKFSFGKAWADRDALVMTFDRHGILETERFESWRQQLGTGTSIQLIIEVGSVVDSTPVRTGFDANDWGTLMLRPLPQTLNAAQSIDDGRYGLEQRGTPDKAGQRTLELRRKVREQTFPLLGRD